MKFDSKAPSPTTGESTITRSTTRKVDFPSTESNLITENKETNAAAIVAYEAECEKEASARKGATAAGKASK